MKVTGEYYAENFRAMNTEIEILIYPPASATLASFQLTARSLTGKIRQLFEEVEVALSRFRPESELSRLNQAGYLEEVSPLLYNSIKAALEMADLTSGIFDPTILDALEQAGYNRSFELLEQSGFVSATRLSFPAFNLYREIKLEPAQHTIRLPYATRLDLGGIAKGMTVDRAAGLLIEAGFKDFMVSAGGDLYVSGSAPGEQSDWEVMVQNPLTLAGNLTKLHVRDCGVATSATTKRSWHKGGKRYHHLIDPRSGKPVENGLASVTVVAPTTQLADVLAKTVLILGLEEGQQFIAQQPGCAALFIGLDGSLVSPTNLVNSSRS